MLMRSHISGFDLSHCIQAASHLIMLFSLYNMLNTYPIDLLQMFRSVEKIFYLKTPFAIKLKECAV